MPDRKLAVKSQPAKQPKAPKATEGTQATQGAQGTQATQGAQAPKAPKQPKAHPLEVLFIDFVVSRAQKVTNILVTYLCVALSVKYECVVLFVGGV